MIGLCCTLVNVNSFPCITSPKDYSYNVTTCLWFSEPSGSYVASHNSKNRDILTGEVSQLL